MQFTATVCSSLANSKETTGIGLVKSFTTFSSNPSTSILQNTGRPKLLTSSSKVKTETFSTLPQVLRSENRL